MANVLPSPFILPKQMPAQISTAERSTVLSYLDEYHRRGEQIIFAHRRGLRRVRWSYAQLVKTAYRFARELEALGICSGERVLLCGENCPEWVAVFWGCLLRGVVVVPLDKESTEEFASTVQRQTDAKLIVAGSDVTASARLGIPQLRLENLREQVALHDDAAPSQAESITEETLVEIIFTSGTTSVPKGVMLTHRNLLANLQPLEAEIAKYIRWERAVHPIRFLNLVPLSHIFGQFMGIFVPQLLGGEVHFQESLNPSEIARAARRSRISVLVIVPRILEGLRDWVERDYDARGCAEELQQQLAATKGMNFLRRWWMFRRVHRRFGLKFWALISGGATLDEGTETFWRGLGFAVLQGYGMTETASLITITHPFKQSRGSIGQLMPGYEVKLDEAGEIMVRGASVSNGYWTAEGAVSRGGDWFHTGDLGEIDAAGNVYFKGRKKDVIVTAAGLNIYPEDLEAALNGQPEVRASCVVAWEGARGAEPLAALLLHHATDASAEVVINRVNAQLAEYQQIRRWFVWPESDFPRTPTHKILKREVAAVVSETLNAAGESREEAAAASHKQEHAFHQPSSFILHEAARISGNAAAERIEPAANPATDLKLDSLGRVELLSALEDRYGVEIDEGAFTAATTVEDLEKIIHGEMEEEVAPYPYPKWTRRFPLTWLRLFLFYTIILPITLVMSRMRASGRDHLAELKSPALFIANHVTLADHALVLAALPLRFRHRLAIAMEGEYLRNWRRPPAGTSWLMRLRLLAQYILVNTFFQVFPLPKQSGFRRSFAYAGECVDGGQSVLVFPEGERAPRGQMRMSRFKTGIGLLAKELNIPVVPVKIDGLYELKQRYQHFAPPGTVRVVFGQPVKFDAQARPLEIAEDLERRVAAL